MARVQLALLFVLSSSAAVHASEVRVLSITAIGLMAMIEQVAPEFERATGHRLVVTFELTADLRRRIDQGEAFDVVIVTPEVIDELAQRSKVATDLRVDFGRTDIGVCVRAGAAKPDIGSVESFRRALLSARSIAYNPDVASGRHVMNVLRRLGLTEELRSRMISAANAPGSNKVTGVVASGGVELGLVITTDIVASISLAHSPRSFSRQSCSLLPSAGTLVSRTPARCFLTSSRRRAPCVRSKRSG